uniref:Uncharacterized protein n=1 Tax=Micrurus carvalhoi TaxID=3147026 RepID=A0A2H6NIT3_9SAUR
MEGNLLGKSILTHLTRKTAFFFAFKSMPFRATQEAVFMDSLFILNSAYIGLVPLFSHLFRGLSQKREINASLASLVANTEQQKKREIRSQTPCISSSNSLHANKHRYGIHG